jgi:hypothetical protein
MFDRLSINIRKTIQVFDVFNRPIQAKQHRFCASCFNCREPLKKRGLFIRPSIFLLTAYKIFRFVSINKHVPPPFFSEGLFSEGLFSEGLFNDQSKPSLRFCPTAHLHTVMQFFGQKVPRFTRNAFWRRLSDIWFFTSHFNYYKPRLKKAHLEFCAHSGLLKSTVHPRFS